MKASYRVWDSPHSVTLLFCLSEDLLGSEPSTHQSTLDFFEPLERLIALNTVPDVIVRHTRIEVLEESVGELTTVVIPSNNK